MKRNRFDVALVIILASQWLVGQSFELRNKINLIIKASTKNSDSRTIRYQYAITSLASSEQNVWRFWIITKDTSGVAEIVSPASWFKPLSNVDPSKNDLVIDWGGPSKRGIRPGESRSDFSFISRSLPGPCSYYAEGYAPAPRFEEGMATDSIPGYTDLTPYGPGIIGQTVGPVMTPSVFAASGFVDTLISYKHQALALKWIDNNGIANSLDQKLDNAKQQLAKGDSVSCKNILKAFVNEVEAQKDKHLTSEAYALLKFNAEYLIDRLPENKGGRQEKK